MGQVTVLVVEPDPELRASLAAFLSIGGELVVVGAGTDLTEACQGIASHVHLDVAVMRLEGPQCTRLEWWALVHGILPGVRVVGLTDNADDLPVLTALGAGVVSLHPIKDPPEVIRLAIRQAAEGTVNLDALLAYQAMKRWLPRQDSTKESTDSRARSYHDPHRPWELPVRLSARQQETLTLIAQGLSNREIGWRLHFSEKTIRNLLSGVFDKIGVRNRTEAALWKLRAEQTDEEQLS